MTEEKTKVYVVFYSDADGYSKIEGVYPTRELAQEHIDALQDEWGSRELKVFEVLDAVPEWIKE